MISNTLSVDVASARRFIENHIDKRQVNKIQHSFPSPRYWTETDVPVREIIADRQRLSPTEHGAPVDLYLGVPYCIKTNPGKCGYCLFPVEDFVGYDALENYYGYLKREVAMHHGAFSGQRLQSVYFGGGTSNLYKEPMYPRLMELVRELFPDIGPDVNITLEGIPQLFSREKLQAIKDCGMNRISVGVQQINEHLNSLSGRKQTTKHVIQTVEWARELGLACNLDLIFGWPQQTVATMVKDLETVISWGVYDVTHYELNVGGPTDFALNRYHELPSTLANLEMYRVSRDLLKSHGYEQITAYNWRKPGDPVGRCYEEGVERQFGHLNQVGLGYAGITVHGNAALESGRSCSYINWRRLNEYKAAIDAGRFPVECGFRHDREDFQICLLFRNLFSLEVDREAFLAAFGLDVYEQFSGVWDALEEWNFATITPDKISLVGDGPFYTPMIQTLLAEHRYRHLRERVVEKTRGEELSFAAY
jgi:oxygen-independent coproporphyrinogen-3 oxidase